MNYVPKKKKMAKEEAIKLGVVTQLAKSSFMIPIRSGLQAVIGDLKKKYRLLLEEIDGVDEAAQLQALERLLELGVKGIAIMPVDSVAIRKKSISLRNKALRSLHSIRTLLVVNVSALSEWITLKAGRQLLDY